MDIRKQALPPSPPSLPSSLPPTFPPPSLLDPGYEGPEGSDAQATLQMMLFVLLWVVIALVLFLFR